MIIFVKSLAHHTLYQFHYNEVNLDRANNIISSDPYLTMVIALGHKPGVYCDSCEYTYYGDGDDDID